MGVTVFFKISAIILSNLIFFSKLNAINKIFYNLFYEFFIKIFI